VLVVAKKIHDLPVLDKYGLVIARDCGMGPSRA
jgi:hypothetical protein